MFMAAIYGEKQFGLSEEILICLGPWFITDAVGFMIVAGTFSFGAIEAITGSMRNSVLGIVVFFVIGSGLLAMLIRKDFCLPVDNFNI